MKTIEAAKKKAWCDLFKMQFTLIFKVNQRGVLRVENLELIGVDPKFTLHFLGKGEVVPGL